MTPENKAGNVSNLCHALGNVARDLIAAGVAPEQLAAGFRIEAATLEASATRSARPLDEREMLDVQRRGHEFINTLQVAGIAERVAVSALGNVLIERVVRTSGAAGAGNWLRALARMVDENAGEIEQTAHHH